VKKIVRTLTALGAFFVVVIAVAACGGSSKTSTTSSANGVPSSDVALVAGNPISKQAFNHWMYVAEKGNSEEDGGPVIVPTDPQDGFTGCVKQVRAQIAEYANTAEKTLAADCKELFTELSTQVMQFLITGYWYQGTGYTQHNTYTAKEQAKDFAAAKKQTFPTKAQYTEFLAETGETLADIKWRLRVNHFYAKLVDKYVPKITKAAEEKYYAANPSSFGTPAERNIKLIQTDSKSTIDKAEAALKSGQSWAKVAKQYSTNTATKSDGGVITDVEANQEEKAVNTVIFASPLNRLEGPIKGEFGYYLVEVTKITAAVTSPFAKEQSEIKSILQNKYQTSAETKVNNEVKKQWLSKTKCAPAYSMDYCAGYVAPKTTTSTTAAGAPATSNTSAAGTPVTTTGAGTTTTPSTGTSTSSGKSGTITVG
jgi:foldase protein PrsA